MSQITQLFVSLIFLGLFSVSNAQVVEGDVTLSTQAEVNAFAGTAITGSLTIHGPDIVDLTPLSNLASVGGHLNIGTWFDGGPIGNDLLINLDGLGNLTSVGGNLEVSDNDLLINLDGLSNLTSVGGYLGVVYNDALVNLDGLSNIDSVGWWLGISNNGALTNLNGLNGLTSLSGDLLVTFNGALTNLNGLSNLTSVGGELLNIQSNASLTNLDGLSNLTSVAMSLEVSDNNSLNRFCGLYALLCSNGLQGGYSVTGNLVNPTQQQIIDDGPCPAVIQGDVTLSTQAEVNAFAGTAITGNLTIRGSDIVDLTPLLTLVSVGGALKIVENDALTNLDGLSNLNSVSGDLLIGHHGYDVISLGNHALTNLNGLSSITSVGGSLYLVDNLLLTNLDGLGNLNSVSGDLKIAENDALTNLDGLSNLNSVSGDLFLGYYGYMGIPEGNHALTNLNGLSNLTSVGGLLYLVDNLLLTNLDGLSNLNSVRGQLGIHLNDALTNLDGLSNLTSIGGDLSVEYNIELTNLDGLSNLNSVSGSLKVIDNDSLTNLNGLGNITSVGGSLKVIDNDSLTNLDGLGNITYVGSGYLTIELNASLNCFCGLYPLLTSNNPLPFYYVTDNLINPTRQQIINDGPCATTALADNELLPQDYYLHQNYPNPFNPSTTISYGLPEDSNVSLIIYDVRGQIVQTLESGLQSAGWYDVVWNGQTADGKIISTSIYFARLKAGDYTKVIKMVYLK